VLEPSSEQSAEIVAGKEDEAPSPSSESASQTPSDSPKEEIEEKETVTSEDEPKPDSEPTNEEEEQKNVASSDSAAEEEVPTLKSSASSGDITETSEADIAVGPPEVKKREPINSTSSRDSFTDELSSVVLRDSKRASSVRLSNGSVSSEKRLSSPAPTTTAHLEDGPVLRPPPPKVERRQSSSEQLSPQDEILEEQGDESMV